MICFVIILKSCTTLSLFGLKQHQCQATNERSHKAKLFRMLCFQPTSPKKSLHLPSTITRASIFMASKSKKLFFSWSAVMVIYPFSLFACNMHKFCKTFRLICTHLITSSHLSAFFAALSSVHAMDVLHQQGYDLAKAMSHPGAVRWTGHLSGPAGGVVSVRGQSL